MTYLDVFVRVTSLYDKFDKNQHGYSGESDVFGTNCDKYGYVTLLLFDVKILRLKELNRISNNYFSILR